jgi:PBP1b-binding outer membrane lipoprotein LpoB
VRKNYDKDRTKGELRMREQLKIISFLNSCNDARPTICVLAALARQATACSQHIAALASIAMLVAVLLATACQTTGGASSYSTRRVEFDVMVNESTAGLEAIKSIAVLDFVSASSNQLGAQVSGLILSKLSESRKYTLVERERIRRVLTEMKLSTIDQTLDSDKIMNIGKLVGADAVIFGDISTATYDVVVINFRMINVESGQILVAVTEKNVRDQRGATWGRPPERLTLERCMADLAERGVVSFVARVAPCTSRQQRIVMESHDPDAASTVNEMGILHVQKGLWADAMQYFASALKTVPTSVAAMNNLAVSKEATGAMEEPSRLYEEAYQMSTNRIVLDNLLEHKKLKLVYFAAGGRMVHSPSTAR